MGIIAAIVIAAITGVAIFINSQNLELKQANDTIKAERDRANEQTEEALRAKKSLEIANDSIILQATQIAQANQDLAESNRRLAEERDNVLKANWKMMENRARAVAEKAYQLTDEGDSYTAVLLALEVLPKDLENPDRTYCVEAESVLREALSIKYA